MSAAEADDAQAWHISVCQVEDVGEAAMQVWSPRGETTIVLWGTPQDADDGGINLRVSLYTNLATEDRTTLSEALAVYLEAVKEAVLSGADRPAPVFLSHDA